MEDQLKLRVIISGGGTGGHVFPAIAIANEIKSQYPDSEILFIGASGKLEMEKVPIAGYPIVGLKVMGLNRTQWWKNFTLPFKLIGSMWKTRKIIRSFRPQVVVGVGGYASAPTLHMAHFMHIPTLIQEQNSFPGLTNKSLAKKVAKICVAYDGMENFFDRDKLALTGNPVRSAIIEADMANTQWAALHRLGLSAEKKTVLVLGGSLGAQSINQGMALGYQKLLDSGYQVIWQTGKYYYERYKRLELGNPDLIIKDFIGDMAEVYAAADLIVSRAGAIAISELCIVGKPVILIPSPNVAEDHQTKNAIALDSQNAAVFMPDSKTIHLAEKIMELLRNERRRELLSENIKRLAKPEATKLIVEEIVKLVKR